MNPYRRQIADALRAVSVRGPARFAWLGRLDIRIDAPIEAAMDAAAHRRHLHAALADRLRRSWYCHGRPIPALPSGGGAFVADQALLAALSAANEGSGTWQPGWTVARLDDGVAVCSDGMLLARVPLAGCRPDDPRPGAAVAVRLPKELPFYAPGFLYILGDADLDDGLEQVRIYWHVTSTGAPLLVRTLTRRLNAAGVPFELKVAAHPHELHRADAAVLYLPARCFAAARAEVLTLADELAAHVRPQVPALTLELAPGVGAAEGIRRAESFGAGRCSLLADAVLHVHEHGGAPLAAVAERFAQAGVAIEAPYHEPALAGRHVL